MATIIKLTYTLSGKSTLLNADKMTTAFRIFEKSTRKYATRINFDNDSFVIVDEELQVIKQLQEDALAGEYQTNDWIELDSGEGEGFHERLENNYHQSSYNRPQRRNNYHQQNNYNNNYNNRY